MWRWWLAATIGLTAPASAQEAPRTPDDYVCLLTGGCGQDQARASDANGRFVLAAAPVAPVDLRLAFASGSARLNPAARAEARALAAALDRPQLAHRRLRIEGHTNTAGGRAANLALSQRRATAVASYLAQHGVARSRLAAIGYGFARPLSGHAASDPANRRVVASLIP